MTSENTSVTQESLGRPFSIKNSKKLKSLFFLGFSITDRI